MRERLKRWFAGSGTAMLAGAIVVVVVGRFGEPHEANALALAVFGALYALAVLGLVRVFRVRSWGLALAGLLCGPLPGALVLAPKVAPDERGGVLFGTALLGVCIGLFEWARQAARERKGEAS